MTLPEAAPDPSHDEDPLDYRSVHTFSVLGLLIGALSLVTLLSANTSFETTLMLAPIPVIGLIVSLVALRAIIASPEVYTGKPLAQAGLILSAFFLCSGVGYAGYVYSTEVPDGYARTSFIEIKPTDNNKIAGKYMPDEVFELIKNQEPVFIKGYIRPDSIKFNQNITDFLLVRDNQQCCFGDLSKVQFFDQIQINLKSGLTTDFNRGLFRVGGVLTVTPGDPSIGTPLTYQLNADYVKP